MTFIEIINSVKDGGELKGEALDAFNALPEGDKVSLARTLKQDYGVTVTGVKVPKLPDEPKDEQGKAIDNPAVNPMVIKEALQNKLAQEGDDPARVTSVDAVVMVDGEDIKTVQASSTEPVNEGSKAIPDATISDSKKPIEQLAAEKAGKVDDTVTPKGKTAKDLAEDKTATTTKSKGGK